MDTAVAKFWAIRMIAMKRLATARKIWTKRAFALGALIVLSNAQVLAEEVDLNRVPDSLDGEGLVIMEVGPLRWQSGEVEFADGKMAKIHEGFLVENLGPGTHTIKSIRTVSGANTTGGIIDTTYYSVVTLNRQFEVRAGEATHLGLAYLLEEPGEVEQDSSREYIVMWFENTGPEMSFLHEYYPVLAGNLASSDIKLAPSAYSNDKLAAVRQLLPQLYAESAMQAREWERSGSGLSSSVPIEIIDSSLIVGDLGLLARIDDEGQIQLVDTGTIDRIAAFESRGTPEWFLTRGGTLLRVRGDSVESVSVSQGYRPVAAAHLGGDSLVLADRRFRLLFSKDGGVSWRMDETAAVDDDEMLRPTFHSGADRVVAIGRDWSYLFKDGAVVTIDRATGVVSELELPRKVRNNMTGVFETERGLYVQTDSLGKPTTLHHQPGGTDDWFKYEISNYMLCNVSFQDNSGLEIRALCGVRDHPAYLLSQDGGESWQRYEPH